MTLSCLELLENVYFLGFRPKRFSEFGVYVFESVFQMDLR